jgi:phosphatidate cytidylyltransferase
MAMHLKRWITAVIAVPLVILLILKGGQTLFSLTVAVITILTLIEYFNIAFHTHDPKVPHYFHVWACICGASVVAAVHYHHLGSVSAILSLHLIGCGLLAVKRFKFTQDAPIVAIKTVFGTFYISVLFSFLVVLRNSGDGIFWASLLLWVIAWGDIGAYYVGSYLGRHKLCPAVSPKKTVEGALGGLAANLIAVWSFNLLFASKPLPLIGLAAYALLVGGAGQVGDLFESLFKRTAGIKDSGGILPGHGGFLDRIDALLFGAPVAFLVKEFFIL